MEGEAFTRVRPGPEGREWWSGQNWCGPRLWGYDMKAIIQHEQEQPMQPQPEQPIRLERSRLRGYHRTLADLMVDAVNNNYFTFRAEKNKIILKSPDNTSGFTVHCRNSDQQRRELERWINAHRQPQNHLTAVPAVHPVNSDEVHVPEPQVDDGPWWPYIDTGGEPVSEFETNGHLYRCILCLGKPSEYVADHTTGIAGHLTMNHRDTTRLRAPETIEKAQDTKRYNRLYERVATHVAALNDALGLEAPADVKALKAENADLKARLAAVIIEKDDAITRLTILREALASLDDSDPGDDV